MPLTAFGENTSRRAGESKGVSVKGQQVCVVGRFVTMTHGDLAQFIHAHGGRFVRWPSRRTSMLVIGGDGWPCRRDGSPCRAVERAQALRNRGCPIRILFEVEFLQFLGLIDQKQSICRDLTIADVAKLLAVPPTHIRRWMRMGLVTPTKTVHRLCYFDVFQVTGARRICHLLQRGATLAGIRRGLEQLQRWLPRRELPFSQLAVLEHDGRLLVRLDGKLAEPNGQLRFDFDANESAAQALAMAAPVSIDALFDRALASEDAGRLEEAAQDYRQAIAIQPGDPVLRFNLGNVLFGMGRYREASDRFQQALRLDGNYVEAWNNLGNTYVRLGAWPEAIRAFRRALRLVPDYSDAKESLAAAMVQLRERRRISLVE